MAQVTKLMPDFQFDTRTLNFEIDRVRFKSCLSTKLQRVQDGSLIHPAHPKTF